ncbi:MAG: type II secretion system secretin GspD [Alteraurantiacibacter sp.]
MTILHRWSLTMIIAAALAAPALGQSAQPTSTANVVVNMRDIDIADVAQQISRITGRTIILDPAVQGTVNVTSATPLSPAGVWELFVTVLRGQGYATVQNGRAWRVIPQSSAAREPSSAGASGSVVTRLVRLENLSSEVAARVLRPLVASFGGLEAVTSPNAIVVTDYADNVARIAGIAASLDRGGSADGFEMISLRYASAQEVATAIEGIMGGDESGFRAVADERSNIVLLRGSKQQIAEGQRIANTLDTPDGAAPVVRVFRLKYNDAETVSEILAGLLGAEAGANNPVARTLNEVGGSRLLNGAASVRETTSAAGGLPALGAGANSIDAPRRADAGVSSNSRTTGFSSENFSIQSSPALNAIVVRGPPAIVSSVESIITELDIRRPQVLIEAAIVEITGDQSEQLGIQLGLGPAADAAINSGATSFSNLDLSLRQALAIVGSPAVAAVAPDGLSIGLGDRGSFGILIQALGQSSRANLLSTPSITTLDNQPAEIVVGQNVPFRTGSFVSQGITTTPFTTIERADVGITLRVVPRIHEGDIVRLEVDQEVSSLIGAVAGAADIVTNRRSINTTVLADDGQTIILGGLISDDEIQTRSQVPILGDIPIVGELFKSRRESKTRRTLFVFLRPTILRDSRSVADASAERYDRLRGAEAELGDRRSLLLEPPQARLPAEVDGIY